MLNLQQPLAFWESVQNFAAFFIFFWLLAVVVHHFFCRKFQWYQNQVIQGTIHVSFGRIYLTSHWLNGPIQRLGSWPKMVKLWRIWFICGVVVSSVLMIPVLVFLLYLFIGHSFRIMRWYTAAAPVLSEPAFPQTVSTSPSLAVSLVPVVPGVNLPLPNVVPFFISILCSTFFHELGHGISAASEFTDVDGVGFALIGVFPAAFVVIKNLDSQALARQLRIMAAGVWHNIVLALFAAFLLWNMAVFIRPFYPQGNGVTVVSIVAETKAVTHSTLAFHPGLEIYAINNCSVRNVKSLERCSINYTKPGFCMTVEQMKAARDAFLPPVSAGHGSPLECCKDMSSSLCFRDDSNMSTPECLHMTRVLQATANHHQPRCNSSLDCSGSQCYVPYLWPTDRFLVFNTSDGPVLFVGDSFGLLRSLRVSNFSRDSLLPLWLPEMLELTLKYFVSISAALALLNLVPSFGLDGCRFAALWLDLLFRYHFLPSRFSRFQSRIVQVLTISSTFFLVADIFLGFTQI